jgi:hypothetical protein
MKYVMVIYQGDAQERQAALPEEERQQVYADYQGINQTPGVTTVPPMGLPENATTVRVEGGKTLITDGPFVGMKEAVGGLFILEADDLDAAIEVAARVPAARYGGAVEIRPSEVYCERRSTRSSARSGAACWRPWSASSAILTSPRRPRRTRSRSPPSAGRATAPPATRAPG